MIDVTVMLPLCVVRSHAAVKEVLPARKSLRLQNIVAETLTLSPKPSGKLKYTPVATCKQRYKVYHASLHATLLLSVSPWILLLAAFCFK